MLSTQSRASHVGRLRARCRREAAPCDAAIVMFPSRYRHFSAISAVSAVSVVLAIAA